MIFQIFLLSVICLLTPEITGAQEHLQLTSDTSTQVHVDANVPLTGSLATFGASIFEGVTLAVESGGCAAGSNVNFNWEDNQGLAKEAVTIARKQLRDSPQIYLTAVLPQYLAIRDIVNQKGLPHFVWIFDTDIRPHGENNFRTWVNFKVEPPLFINYAKKLNPKRIAIVYVQLPSTDEEYLNHLLPELQESGFKEAKVFGYPAEQETFQELASRVKAFNPDLVFISGFPANLVNMIRTFRSFKIIHDSNTIGSYDLLDTAPLMSNEEMEGLRVSTPSFLLNTSEASVKSWIDSFQKRFSKMPLYTHAYAYDMACIIAHAAQTAKTEDISSLGQKLKATDIHGITGRLKFDENGDLLPNVELGVFRNGHPVRE